MKKSKNKIIKILVIIIISISLLGLTLGIFVDWKFPSWIYISGSSTMQPLLEKISNNYKQAEVIADAGGSSLGISNLLNSKKQLAAVSKNISVSQAGLPKHEQIEAISGKDSVAWEKDKIKTITISYDGIGIIYKGDDNQLDINQNNINTLFDLFSGQKEYKMNQLDAKLSDKTIIPFARTGGANLSGTAEAFLHDSGFDLQKLSSTTSTILTNGKYGKYTIETSETNLQTWSKIKDYSIDANHVLMTYLSTGFIKNNYQQIINEGFKIATYKSEQLFVNGLELNLTKGYDWYRPFNLLLKLSHVSEDIKKFITWLLKESTEINSNVYNVISDLGYLPLDKTQIRTMFPNNSLWESDYELLSSQYNERSLKKRWYGAF